MRHLILRTAKLLIDCHGFGQGTRVIPNKDKFLEYYSWSLNDLVGMEFIEIIKNPEDKENELRLRITDDGKEVVITMLSILSSHIGIAATKAGRDRMDTNDLTKW